MLFSEPKIPQFHRSHPPSRCNPVSVLFSEPKIPQSPAPSRPRFRPGSFSALQRAENSSINSKTKTSSSVGSVSVLFSEPKIPQYIEFGKASEHFCRFSALQRAENSSILSRLWIVVATRGFSALQRAENSSILTTGAARRR